jgi:HEAT repeat protein
VVTADLSVAVYEAARRRDTATLTAMLDEPSVRHLAARHLGHLRHREAVPSLVALLSDDDRAVRLAAVRALGDLGEASTGPALRAVAETDSDPGIRSWALVAVGKTRDPQAMTFLIGELQRSDVELRRVAAFALGELGDRRALGALRAARRLTPLRRRFDFVRASWKIRRHPLPTTKR